MQDKTRQLVKPTVIYGLTISLLLWLFYFQTIETPTFGGLIQGFKLSQLFSPLALAATSLYCSILVQKITQGKLSEPLTQGLKLNSFSLPLFIISYWPQIPEYFTGIYKLPFYITTLYTTFEIAELRLNNYHDLSSPIIKGIKIAAIGLILSNIYAGTLVELKSARMIGEISGELDVILSSPIINSLTPVIRASALLSMIASFAGVLRINNNPYLSYTGSVLSTKLSIKFLIFMFLGSYFAFLRSSLLQLTGISVQLLGLIEWTLVCLFFYRGYKSANSYSSVFVENIGSVLKWTKHKQDIKYVTDQKLDNLSSLVQTFVESGDKTLLEITLTSLMTNYGYSPSKIHNILQEFIEYIDVEPGIIAFNWQVGYLESRNRINRGRIIANTLEELQRIHIIMEDEPPENKEYEVIEQ